MNILPVILNNLLICLYFLINLLADHHEVSSAEDIHDNVQYVTLKQGNISSIILNTEKINLVKRNQRFYLIGL